MQAVDLKLKCNLNGLIFSFHQEIILQPRYNVFLLKSVIETIGLDRAVQIFQETSQIQEAGGIMTQEEEKSRM